MGPGWCVHISRRSSIPVLDHICHGIWYSDRICSQPCGPECTSLSRQEDQVHLDEVVHGRVRHTAYVVLAWCLDGR